MKALDVEDYYLLWRAEYSEGVELEKIKWVFCGLFKNVSSCERYMKRTDPNIIFHKETLVQKSFSPLGNDNTLEIFRGKGTDCITYRVDQEFYPQLKENALC